MSFPATETWPAIAAEMRAAGWEAKAKWIEDAATLLTDSISTLPRDHWVAVQCLAVAAIEDFRRRQEAKR